MKGSDQHLVATSNLIATKEQAVVRQPPDYDRQAAWKAKVAQQETGCCDSTCSCRGNVSEQIGYPKEDLASLPRDAEMGLGCGNPISFAELRVGEVVLDLGSGGVVDCFLASKIVGATGKVISRMTWPLIPVA